jgi:hypothetical protein
MERWFNLYTFVAFVVGVLLSAMVKAQLASLRGAASKATG